MSTFGRAYIMLNIERELELQNIDLHDKSIDGLEWIMGMHMAFDPEASEKLDAMTTDFGWKIVERELPSLHAKVGTDEETEQVLELCVDAATHYGHQLLNKLTLMWLARD